VGRRKPHNARAAPCEERTSFWRAKAHRRFSLLVPRYRKVNHPR